MTFAYNRKLMAQALSVVGEAGIHGMEYNGLLDSWVSKKTSRRSKRFRFSGVSAHRFSGSEFENYMILAWRFGFVERSKYKEVEWKYGPDKSSYEVEDEIVRLTHDGWVFVEVNDQPLLHRWGRNILDNVPAILVSVATALLIGWALKIVGPPN